MAQKKSSPKKPAKKPLPSKKAASVRRPVAAKSVKRSAESSKPKAKAKSSSPPPTPPRPPAPVRPTSKIVVQKNSNPIAEQGRAIKKEKKGLSKSDLQYFRNLLLEKRRELLGDVGSMESEAFKGGSNLSNMPIHMADVGTDNFEQEFTLGLIESERQILREIQDALVRCDSGIYGICQGTGNPIPRVRLEAVPWAKYTIEYSRLLESGKLNRDSAASSDDDGGDDDED